MAPKWNRILVEEDPGVVEQYEDGRMMRGLNVAACAEDVEQVRTGYRCINCWEPLDEAWPKNCPLCTFPIREHQAEHFANVYKGYDPSLRTGADWEREADRIAEAQERRDFEKRTGISVAIGKTLRRR